MPCEGRVWQAQGRRPTPVFSGVSERAWCQPVPPRTRTQRFHRPQVSAGLAAFAGNQALHSWQMGRCTALLSCPPRRGRRPAGSLLPAAPAETVTRVLGWAAWVVSQLPQSPASGLRWSSRNPVVGATMTTRQRCLQTCGSLKRAACVWYGPVAGRLPRRRFFGWHCLEGCCSGEADCSLWAGAAAGDVRRRV